MAQAAFGMTAKRLGGLAVVVWAALGLLGACAHQDRSSAIARLTNANLGDLSADGRSGVTATFFGASTVLIGDGSSAILIDGFVTRPSTTRLLTKRLTSDEYGISEALPDIDGQRLEGIFVAHSHHDHVLDASTVARRFQTRVFGSRSVGQVVRAEGLASTDFTEVGHATTYPVGPFVVTALRTPHSPDDLADGEVSPNFASPARLLDYRSGQNFSFFVRHRAARVLIVPSANFEPHTFAGYNADVVFLSVGRLGRQSDAFIERYWCETVLRTGARLVVPMHWDDFTQPLSRPLPVTPAILDDVERAFLKLTGLAQRDGVLMYGMDAFDTLSFNRVNDVTHGSRLPSQTCDR